MLNKNFFQSPEGKYWMPESDFQMFSTFQSPVSPGKAPVTFATAATITPVSFLTLITGTAATVATITPPVEAVHMLCFIFSVGAVLNVTGNIANAATSVSATPVFFVYNPLTKKYTASV